MSHFFEYDRHTITKNVPNMIPRYGAEPLFKEWWREELEEENFECAVDFAERSIIGTIVDELRDMLMFSSFVPFRREIIRRRKPLRPPAGPTTELPG